MKKGLLIAIIVSSLILSACSRQDVQQKIQTQGAKNLPALPSENTQNQQATDITGGFDVVQVDKLNSELNLSDLDSLGDDFSDLQI